MLDFLNQPIDTPVMLVLMAVLLLIVYLAIQREHKKSKDNSQKYMNEHPDAATLYLYAEDLPSNGAEVQCIRVLHHLARRQKARSQRLRSQRGGVEKLLAELIAGMKVEIRAEKERLKTNSKAG